MARPNFRQALHEATDALLKEASASLHRRSLKAITRLEHIASDPGEPATARVAACRALVSLTLRMAETVQRNDQIAFLREEIGRLTVMQAHKTAGIRKITQECAIELSPSALPAQ